MAAQVQATSLRGVSRVFAALAAATLADAFVASTLATPGAATANTSFTHATSTQPPADSSASAAAAAVVIGASSTISPIIDGNPVRADATATRSCG